VIRRASDPPFGPEDIARFHLYLLHFREAMRCAARVRRAEAQAHVFSEIFDRLRVATVVTDRFASVRYANGSAEALLGEGNGIVPSHGNNLMAMTGAATARLHAAILKVLSDAADGGAAGDGAAGPTNSLVRLPRPDQASDLIVSIAPVGGRGRDRVGHQMLAVLFVLDPERRYEGDGEALQRLFGLTDAEASVALGIAQGHSARDISGMNGRAYETVRSHLKSVYEKTGARSRADLCSIVHSLVVP
jgi:DNA-binding CsgD family transcriptional regulator